MQAAAAQYFSKYEVDVQILDVAMAGREAFEKPGLTRIFGSGIRWGNRQKFQFSMKSRIPRAHCYKGYPRLNRS